MPSDDLAQALAKLADEVRSLRDEVRGLKHDDLLTVEQYAKVTGRTANAVRTAIWRGTLKVVRDGRIVRIPRPR